MDFLSMMRNGPWGLCILSTLQKPPQRCTHTLCVQAQGHHKILCICKDRSILFHSKSRKKRLVSWLLSENKVWNQFADTCHIHRHLCMWQESFFSTLYKKCHAWPIRIQYFIEPHYVPSPLKDVTPNMSIIAQGIWGHSYRHTWQAPRVAFTAR